ncbi:hypothetical protein BS47DRAFT_1364974 [Hydnum rufescens UP504]|uniref:peptidylprolyl isomerase n=1 Tax=Hydnum rufescens UP504 TaxID=1448309 RepID=A0A9P6AQ90_9AGAM|nr:hypothetical protein BS47DRAFT_1364974 [Hydnum rufescens UP504]
MASSVKISTVICGDGKAQFVTRYVFGLTNEPLRQNYGRYKEFIDADRLNLVQESAATGFVFELGTGNILKGWDEALPQLSLGEKAVLVIPPDLAYGPGFPPVIPPDSTIYVEIELWAIN